MGEFIEPIDPGGVAARLRALVKCDAEGDLSPLARRLGVNEAALRESLSENAPRLDVRTLSAIVHEFGVDPSWLLTGEYNSATHHMALEDDKLQSASAVTQIITARLSPIPSLAIRTSDISENL